jgi:putative transposase
MRYMVKLNERKIRWIIHEKMRGRGTGEIALIQRVSRRRIEQLWQAYTRDGVIPTLKKPGRPRNASISLRDAALILETYDRLKVNALTLQRALKHTRGVNLPHNKIHAVLKENGRALPQSSKQRRRRWVRYEREHSMSLWHMDWKQLWDGRWWIAAEDDDYARLLTTIPGISYYSALLIVSEIGEIRRFRFLAPILTCRTRTIHA